MPQTTLEPPLPSLPWRGRVLALPLLAAAATPAGAAEDDRGPRGFFVAGGPVMLTGTAADDEGRSAGTWTGGGGVLRLGEEVVPGLTLGLAFGGGSGAGSSDRFDLGVGGFVVQVGWRPFEAYPELQVLAATGLGGGSLTPKGDDGFEGAAAGALHQVGLTYEIDLGDPHGVALGPALQWSVVPPSEGAEAWISAITLGLEVVWYAGRG